MLRWLAQTDGSAGEFIKANRHPSGGNCFVLTTPAGQKLAGGNGGGGASQALSVGLKKWADLSATQRRALPDGKEFMPPEAQQCRPPAGALVLKSYIRNLNRNADGSLARISHDDLKDGQKYPGWNSIYCEPARYNVWITADEAKSLVPKSPTKGQMFEMPDAIQKRLLRYHLVNGTFGLPGAWRLQDIRTGQITLTVVQTAPRLQMRLEGSALLCNDKDPEKSSRGFDATLFGWIEVDSRGQTVSRFDLLALGDYWGGDYEGGRFKRPGRTPLGIAFEMVPAKTAVDLAPPLVHMDRNDAYQSYFSAER